MACREFIVPLRVISYNRTYMETVVPVGDISWPVGKLLYHWEILPDLLGCYFTIRKYNRVSCEAFVPLENIDIHVGKPLYHLTIPHGLSGSYSTSALYSHLSHYTIIAHEKKRT